MKVTIIGIGMGNPQLLTGQARTALEGCDYLVGAKRLLDAFSYLEKPAYPSVLPEDIACIVTEHSGHAAALVSGDVGFYSASKRLKDLLPEAEVEAVCGISCIQYFCAKLLTSWEDAKIISLHGRDAVLSSVVARHKKSFVLTGGKDGAHRALLQLTEAGLGGVEAYVGENLSYPDERITRGTAASLLETSFLPLNVMLLLNHSPQLTPATHGMPDEAFLRGKAPMSKAQVRAVSICELRLRQGDIVWDVGAGTGSVSVEIARVLQDGRVFAIEKEPEALGLLRQNKERLDAYTMEIVAGTAPDALEELPTPDAVFIGGSTGNLAQIVSCILRKNPDARMVINAVTLETLTETLAVFKEKRISDQQLLQLTAAIAEPIGRYHMLKGQNPVYILSGGGRSDDR